MYRWRRMTAEQRRAILQSRQSHQLPWHSPPHYTSEAGVYLLTAACFEHRPIIGRSAERMAAFERGLLDLSARLGERLYAWTVLPNHYHLLTKATDVKKFLRALGRLHGRTSFHWNGEVGRRGRSLVNAERHESDRLAARLCAPQRVSMVMSRDAGLAIFQRATVPTAGRTRRGRTHVAGVPNRRVRAAGIRPNSEQLGIRLLHTWC